MACKINACDVLSVARGKLQRSESDRSKADYRDGIVRLKVRAAHCVSSNSQRFDQRKLLKRQCVRFVQVANRNYEAFLHSAVNMYAENLEHGAAIRLATLARNAAAAVHIRLDGASVTRLDSTIVFSDLEHLRTKFMSQNAGIADKGVPTVERMQISSTHSDLAYAHKSLLLRRGTGIFDIPYDELPWLF
jgi:hypothetical protein